MMKCKHCGAQLSEHAKFCGVCGHKVEQETEKQSQSQSTSNKDHNQGKGKEENQKKTGVKKGIISAILLLCVIVAGAGFFYYKKSGGSADSADGNKVEKSKNDTVKKAYKDSANGINNEVSTYYDGYIYYKKGNEIWRHKEEENDGEEDGFVCYLEDETDNFVVMDGDIYINTCNDTEDLYKLLKVDASDTVTVFEENADDAYLYTEDETVYYCTWDWEENAGEGRVETINKEGETTKLFDFPTEFMQSAYYAMEIDRRYVYYYAEDGIKRINITQKNCNPELVFEINTNQEYPYVFSPYNDTIYYNYIDDSSWYAYDIKTKTAKEILTKSMFEEEDGDYWISNFKGDYAYIDLRDEEDNEDNIYRFNLKTEKLEWLTVSYDDSSWDICNNHLVFSSYDEENEETEVYFKEV